MYKKVLTCIYDTVFCNDFGNIKTNHICCNMTNKLKDLLKIYCSHRQCCHGCSTTLLQRVAALVQRMAT